MSKSEKMRYIGARPPRYNINQHLSLLKRVLSGLPDKGHLLTLKEYAVHDDRLLYKMVARFVPLDYEDCRALVKGIVEDEKNGEDMIMEDGEVEVEKITDALLQRAASLTDDGDLDGAADIAFAIIKAIEPEMESVYDEGWTFQCIMQAAFDFLADMIDDQDKPEKAAHLRERLLQQHEARTDAERYCDHMWDEALNV